MAATTVGFFWHPPVTPAAPLRPISGTTWFHSRFIVSMIANAVMPRKKARAMGVQALRSRADAKAADLAPIIKELRAAGKTSLRAIAAGLNDSGVPTARGGKWSSAQMMRMLERLDPFREEEAAA